MAGKVPDALRDQLGIAIAKRDYKAYRELLSFAALAASLQRRRAAATAAVGQHRNQGSKGLRRPLHQGAGGAVHCEHDAGGHAEGARRSRRHRRDHCRRMAAIAKRCWRGSPKAGIDVDALAAQLQEEGAKSFTNSWSDLMSVVGSKCALLKRAS